ncbi:sugar efflux transporter [Paenibacillus lentus]|uniref:MFS transporter n=1 Tax=Paenibacillus lentus TaxID=1338368 RepID=A0A3Q8S5H7_9BACL|nr:sugar efflux transporter [Paenibacillus lentus]AZK47454.1 MFS transporter [Paenibacillus lentus]
MKSVLNMMRNPAVLLLSVCIFFIGMGYSLTLPFMPLFGVEKVGMTPLSLGTFLAVGSLCGIICSTIIGRLSDKKPVRKWIVIGSSASASLGYVFYAFNENYVVLFIVVSTLIAVSYAAFPQLFSLAREITEREASVDIPVVMSVMRALVSLAWIVGPVIASFVIQKFDYQGLFLTVAAMYLLVGLFVLFLPAETQNVRPTNTSTEQTTATKINFKNVLLSPHVIFALLAFMAFEIANSMGGIVTPLYITQDLSGEKLDVGIIAGINAALQVPIMITLGLMAKRFGSSLLMNFAGLFGAAYYLFLMLTQSTIHIMAVQILSAIFIAIVLGIGMTFFQDLIPKMVGTATTLYNNANIIGSMGGGLLAGLIGEYYPIKTVILASAILCFMGFALLKISTVSNASRLRIKKGDSYEG